MSLSLNNILCGLAVKGFHKQIAKISTSLWQSTNSVVHEGSCEGCNARFIRQLSTQPPVRSKHPATVPAPPIPWHPGVLSRMDRIKWNTGFFRTQVPNQRLLESGTNLYICCTDFVDFEYFLKETGLPDYFSSWFRITQLHLWMAYVKLAQLGPEGYLLIDYMYTYMWQDVEKRLRRIDEIQVITRKKETAKLYSSYVQGILNYDEGIINDDRVLANALWLIFYNGDANVTPQQLTLMVEYVRKNVAHHDGLDPKPLIATGYLSFLPLHGTRLDKPRASRDLRILLGQLEADAEAA